LTAKLTIDIEQFLAQQKHRANESRAAARLAYRLKRMEGKNIS